MNQKQIYEKSENLPPILIWVRGLEAFFFEIVIPTQAVDANEYFVDADDNMVDAKRISFFDALTGYVENNPLILIQLISKRLTLNSTTYKPTHHETASYRWK